MTVRSCIHLSFRLDVLNALGRQILEGQIALQMLAKLLWRRSLRVLRLVMQIEAAG